MSRVDDALQSKMVLCHYLTHPRNPLQELTKEHDAQIVPFKDTVFAWKYRLATDRDIDHEAKRINCTIATLRGAGEKQHLLDDDIILFRADNFYINDLALFKKAVSKIVDEGFELVIRNFHLEPFTKRCSTGYNPSDYYFTDCFLIRVSTARALFKNLSPIDRFAPIHPADPWQCMTAEHYLTRQILSKIQRIYKINFRAPPMGDTELGFCHMNADLARDVSSWGWDGRGYETLYQ